MSYKHKKRGIMRKLNTLIFISFIISAPSANDFSKHFIKVAKIANPSVVSIVTEKTFKNQSPFFFDQYEYKGSSLGSGVIIDASEGYIITNNHVIENSEEIQVILYDRTEIDAKIIGRDPLSDIALLKIDLDDLKAFIIGDSENLSVGQWVMAIGSPFGKNLSNTVTAGIVSAIGRTDVISRRNFEDFIQHDAAINPGNSGGALVNLEGELIGINTAIATGDNYSKSNAGVGFAIPINQAMRVVEDLINNGEVSRGWLGVQIQDLSDDMANHLNLNDSQGAIVIDVVNDSPADQYGFVVGDVITEVDGNKVENGTKLRNLVSSKRPDESVKFKVFRDGRKKMISVRLGERPKNLDGYSFQSNNKDFDILGLKLKSENGQVIITEVDKESNAYKKDLRPGDIILEIGRNEIKNLNEYTNILSEYNSGDSIMLRIKNNDSVRFVAFLIN